MKVVPEWPALQLLVKYTDQRPAAEEHRLAFHLHCEGSPATAQKPMLRADPRRQLLYFWEKMDDPGRTNYTLRANATNPITDSKDKRWNPQAWKQDISC